MGGNYHLEAELLHLDPGVDRAEVTLTYGPSLLYPWAWIAAVVSGTDTLGGRQIRNRVEKHEVPLRDSRLVFDAPASFGDGAGRWRLEDMDVRYGAHRFEIQVKEARTHFTSERPRWAVEGSTLVYEGPAALLGRERQLLPRHFTALRAIVDHRPFSRIALPWRNAAELLEKHGWREHDGGFRHRSGATLDFYAEAGILGLPEKATVQLPLLASAQAAEAIVVDEAKLVAFLERVHPAWSEPRSNGAERQPVLSRIRFHELWISLAEWSSLRAVGSTNGVGFSSTQGETHADLKPLLMTLEPASLPRGHYLVAAIPAEPWFGVVILKRE